MVYAQKTREVAADQICKCIEEKAANTEQIHLGDSIARCFGDAIAVHIANLKDEFSIKEKGTTVQSVWEVRDSLLAVLEKRCPYFKTTK